jgi:2-keto-4-pentenoate hydratase
MDIELKRIADRIDVDIRACRRFEPLRIDGKPLDLEQAYRVQADIVERAMARGAGEPVGYKVGLTGSAMQKFCGVTQPVVGRILAGRVRPNGATLRAGDYMRLGIECELAVRIAKPLPLLAEGTEPTHLLDHVDAIAAAFELVEDRDADYKVLDAFSIIAENSWNMGMVLGGLALPTEVADLANLEGKLVVDGQGLAVGVSSDIMGSPLHVLAWLARFATEMKLEVRPGDWIMTGSIISTVFAAKGRHYRFELGDLPPVEVSIV